MKSSTPLPQSYLSDVLAHTAVLEAQGGGESSAC